MKNILKIGIAAGMILGVSSCKKYLDVNVDPNRSTFTTPELQLPTSQLYIGNAIGDRVAEITNVFSQYYTGGPGVSLGDWDKNTMATSEGNQVFNGLYRSNSNLSYIINKGNEPYYTGIAKILSAYNFQVNADLFGDVPFNDALKGDLNDGFITAPQYDNAETVVYPGIEAMILEGLHLLDSNNASLAVPGENDLIYNGDLDLWKKFGRSVLLKIYLRSGQSAKFAALYDEDPTGFILSQAENASIHYDGGAKSSNPWWNDARSTSLGNYFVGSKTTIDFLTNTADPRIDYFFDPNNAHVHAGLKQGDVENSPATASYSTPSGANVGTGGILFNPKAPVILMSGWEVNFILAEAAARGWITADAAEYYNAAITENAAYLESEAQRFEYDPEGTGTYNLTANIATFIAGPGAISATDPLESIALQKWVSMNGLQPIEAWIETRRLDNATLPVFTSPGGIFEVPTNNVLGGSLFPQIFFYPQSEQDLNSSAPAQHANSLQDKVFWDN